MAMDQTGCNGGIRLIVSDVDFTFVTQERALLPENLAAVREAQAAGVPFAFCSGRAWHSLAEWSRMLQLTAPQVMDNGATLVSPKDGRVLREVAIPEATARFLYASFLAEGFLPILCTSNIFYAVQVDEVAVEHLRRTNEPLQTVPSEADLKEPFRHAVKVGVFTRTRRPELEALVARLHAAGAARGLDFAYSFTEFETLVISATGATKTQGVAAACRELGCTMAEVMAIGDGDNDAELLSAVGLGVAVANATPLAKAAARMQVASCDEAGVAQAIRRVLAGGWRG